jgi:hypothetical protein
VALERFDLIVVFTGQSLCISRGATAWDFGSSLTSDSAMPPDFEMNDRGNDQFTAQGQRKFKSWGTMTWLLLQPGHRFCPAA